MYAVPRGTWEERLSFIGPVRAAPRDRELTETSSCQTHWLCDGLSVRQSERTPRHTGSTATSMKDTHTKQCFFFFPPVCIGRFSLRGNWGSDWSSPLLFFVFFLRQSQEDSRRGPRVIAAVATHLCFPYSYEWRAGYNCQPWHKAESGIKRGCRGLTTIIYLRFINFKRPYHQESSEDTNSEVCDSPPHRASQPSRRNGLKGSIIALFHALPSVCQKYPRWWIGRRNLRLVKAGFSGPDIV